MADEKLPFTTHLEELRTRLIRIAIAVGVGFVITYFFSEDLFKLLMAPLLKTMPPESTLIFTGIAEAFFTYLKVALVAGVFLASPVIFYQIWLFIAPGLYTEEKLLLIPATISSAFFFVGGALFGYYLVFPLGFKYFLSFATDMIKPMPSVKEYFSFSVKLLFAFGLTFELPLFIFILARLGIVDYKMLSAYRKYALLLVFTAAAVITPPDVLSQLMLAFPMLLLYELGIIVARLFGKKKVKKEENTKETRQG